jgi:predicted transcriptional regulator
MAAMLRTANKGASKTRIMYGAHLSYAQMQGYLEFLMERGFLSHDEENRTYELTEKGLRFLHAYDKLEGLIVNKTEEGDGEEVVVMPDYEAQA